MTTEKKEHWTKSPEGQLKLQAAMKKMWAAKKAGKKVATTKRKKYTKKAKGSKLIPFGQFTVKITGPDAQLAMTDILAQYYKVTVTVTKE